MVEFNLKESLMHSAHGTVVRLLSSIMGLYVGKGTFNEEVRWVGSQWGIQVQELFVDLMSSLTPVHLFCLYFIRTWLGAIYR